MGLFSKTRALEARFKSMWVAQYPTVPYYLGNQNQEGVPTTTFVRMRILPGEGAQVGMGNLRKFRYVGVIAIQALIPAGRGEGEAQKIHDFSKLIFEGQTIDGVVIRGASLTAVQPTPIEPWLTYLTTFDYYFDEDK